MHRLLRPLRWGLVLLAVILATVFVARSWEAFTGPELSPWHTFVPDEASADEIDAMDWAEWLVREDDLAAAIEAEVTAVLAPQERVAENRFHAGSPLHAPAFATDWNRSFVLVPEGPIRGAAVLVHGLTDAPFSLRHVAEVYRNRGFVAVVPRMPGHGTVPGGLAAAVWPEWLAATRLAVREAVARAGADAPLHLVGYSNGGALVTKYALDALEDPDLARPDQIVLLSPMIGVTAFARFAAIAGWPAIFPAFVRAAWLDVMPEFNPFKYNSFPVQAAVQSHRLTVAVQRDLERLARSGALAAMAPVLTFQSVVDATVSTPAVISALYGRLPENGSALVLFDVNRGAAVSPVLRPAAETAVARLLPPAPRVFATEVVTNAAPGSYRAVAVVTPAGATESTTVPLAASYPRDVFSLSHVALPFPLSDGLYGAAPDPSENFGVSIGTLASRGEFGVLGVSLDTFARMYSNPFFVELAARIEDAIDASLR
jgi:alpha-beta hydrolase superfamily lysophospholipase